MNKIWILAVAMLLTANYTKAQLAETNNTTNSKQINKTTNEAPFKIIKGYYSIYRNANKLSHQPVKIITDSGKTPNSFAKGFYAIGNKHTQLHKGGKSFIVVTSKRTTATKGYYSIKPPEVSSPKENLIADEVD